MAIPDWLWQELAANAIYDFLLSRGAAATLAWKNRRWIVDKLQLNNSLKSVVESLQPQTIRVTVGDAIGVTDSVSAEVTATWNTHALVGSERKAIWNIEARNRLIDVAIEEAVWVLPDLERRLFR